MTRETVFIVDDDDAVLFGLGQLIQAHGFCVRSFGSPEEFLRGHDKTVSGCILLDMAMPSLNGFAVQQALHEERIDRPIIFLTGRGDIHSSVQAMKAGAVNFLTKPVDEEELLTALREAMEKDRSSRRAREEEEALRRQIERLTPREREVWAHILAGQLNKQIASDLDTAERTIKFHRAHLMHKLGAQSIVDLVKLAERAGIRPAASPAFSSASTA